MFDMSTDSGSDVYHLISLQAIWSVLWYNPHCDTRTCATLSLTQPFQPLTGFFAQNTQVKRPLRVVSLPFYTMQHNTRQQHYCTENRNKEKKSVSHVESLI